MAATPMQAIYTSRTKSTVELECIVFCSYYASLSMTPARHRRRICAILCNRCPQLCSLRRFRFVQKPSERSVFSDPGIPWKAIIASTTAYTHGLYSSGSRGRRTNAPKVASSELQTCVVRPLAFALSQQGGSKLGAHSGSAAASSNEEKRGRQ